MKHKKITYIPILGILIICSLYSFKFSFQQKSAVSDNLDSQYSLIQRSEKIQLGKEWDFVQNTYTDLIHDIKTSTKPNEAKLKLAELFIQEARVTGEHGHYYPASLSCINEILDDPSISEDVKFRCLLTKAGILLSLHQFNEALDVANQAGQLTNLNAQLYGVLVDCYTELGEYEKATKAADHMMRIKPDIRSYARISYLREIHGDIQGAEKALSMAIKSGYPGYEETAWAMHTLAQLHIEHKNLKDATEIYTSLLQIRENYPFAIAGLGDIEFAKLNLAKAEAFYHEAIQIIPEVGFYTSLAKIYQQEKRTNAFKKIIDEIFVMLKEDTDAGHIMNLEYANIYLNLLDNNEKALEYALKEYKKRPNNIDVNSLLSAIYEKDGNIELAKKHLKVASIFQS